MKKKNIIILCIASLLIMLLGVGGFFLYRELNNKKDDKEIGLPSIASTITLDINPSVEINLDKEDKVISIVALNEDAKEITKGIEKGNALDNAISTITANLVNEGYTKDKELVIVLGVNGDIKSEDVKTVINTNLDSKGVTTNIIVPTITETAKELAEKYNITSSKAAYLEEVVENYGSIKIEDIVSSSVSEIIEKTEKIEKEEDKKEDKPVTEKPNNEKPSGGTTSKPNNVLKAPDPNDLTGAWCTFFDSIPVEGGVEYETPGYISDFNVYYDAAEKYLTNQGVELFQFQKGGGGGKSFPNAHYCSSMMVNWKNADQTKEYILYFDVVTLEVLEMQTKELEKPNITEAQSIEIANKFVLDNYGVTVDDTCGIGVYYTLDGSTYIPEYQYHAAHCYGKTYYITVNGRTGEIKNHWTS